MAEPQHTRRLLLRHAVKRHRNDKPGVTAKDVRKSGLQHHLVDMLFDAVTLVDHGIEDVRGCGDQTRIPNAAATQVTFEVHQDRCGNLRYNCQIKRCDGRAAPSHYLGRQQIRIVCEQRGKSATDAAQSRPEGQQQDGLGGLARSLLPLSRTDERTENPVLSVGNRVRMVQERDHGTDIGKAFQSAVPMCDVLEMVMHGGLTGGLE